MYLGLGFFFSSSLFFPDVDALLKKSEAQHEQPEDGCPFGPLTQRLLQALVEVRGLCGAVQRLGSVGPCCHLAPWGGGAVTLPSCSHCQENIISPVEDSPIPEITGKDSGADGAGTSPRSQNKPFR